MLATKQKRPKSARFCHCVVPRHLYAHHSCTDLYVAARLVRRLVHVQLYAKSSRSHASISLNVIYQCLRHAGTLTKVLLFCYRLFSADEPSRRIARQPSSCRLLLEIRAIDDYFCTSFFTVREVRRPCRSSNASSHTPPAIPWRHATSPYGTHARREHHLFQRARRLRRGRRQASATSPAAAARPARRRAFAPYGTMTGARRHARAMTAGRSPRAKLFLGCMPPKAEKCKFLPNATRRRAQTATISTTTATHMIAGQRSRLCLLDFRHDEAARLLAAEIKATGRLLFSRHHTQFYRFTQSRCRPASIFSAPSSSLVIKFYQECRPACSTNKYSISASRNDDGNFFPRRLAKDTARVAISMAPPRRWPRSVATYASHGHFL